MPTVEQYAASIVEKYHVDADTGSPSHRAADEIIPLLKQWGKQYLQGITLSGAYAKNTAITLSSHVDVLIALSPVPNMDMKKVFWSLFEFFSDRNLRPRTRDVSVQVQCKGLWVDLIPACRDRGSSGNLLYNKKLDAAVSTDVAQHIHLIANSGRQQEICALKIWRARQSLDFPSLYLELTALHALEGERFGQLADNVLTVLRYLASRFEPAQVRDPANAKNVLSDDLSESGRQAIAKAARNALYDENWKRIIW
ncbi:MAG TPA: hypothetical protein VGS05_00150 [Candidatus Sulfotelmatobacter sp.]|nr:hypothetical protein [Candidatus Sulfotelmatobacter sp.]